MQMDSRILLLTEWLQSLGMSVDSVKPASADASFRRYFRVQVKSQTFIVMDAPPDKENTGLFVRIARRFREIGLNVPEVIHENSERGFLLLSDLGEQMYLGLLNPDTVEHLYGDAMSALLELQIGGRAEPDFLPPYDRKRLLDEMALFPDWLLVKHLSRELDQGQQQALEDCFERLASSALEQPKVWVHRDYHSRNLMKTENNNPGILDFQDAVTGPITYDLVSLLKDCYIAWPREQVRKWARSYQRRLLDSGFSITKDEQEFARWFDLMGVQRHLKAAGIFARLYHRDRKPGYLDDIPRTVAYISSLRGEYPELKPLIEIIDAIDWKLATRASSAS